MEKLKKDKKSTNELSVLIKIMSALEAGLSARSVTLSAAEVNLVTGLQLLTMKQVNFRSCNFSSTCLLLQQTKVIYAANVLDSELAEGNEMSSRVFELAQKENSAAVLVSAQVERGK